MNDEIKPKKGVKSEKDMAGSSSDNKIQLKVKMSFDAYFQGLMKEKKGYIMAHHKAPMRRYAEKQGITEGTKEEFDQVFRLY